MPLSMYGVAMATFTQTLTALSGILGKADAHCAAKKIDPAVLVQTRLYPDMFALARQIQTACDFAKNTFARIGGVEAPKFADDEKTLDELKKRVVKTLEFLKSVKREQIDGTEAKSITFPVGPNTMTLTGEQYLVNFALPNFYFHSSMAHGILRHCGVEIGKRDFLARA